jgi:hypothetical protein
MRLMGHDCKECKKKEMVHKKCFCSLIGLMFYIFFDFEFDQLESFFLKWKITLYCGFRLNNFQFSLNIFIYNNIVQYLDTSLFFFVYVIHI